MAEVAQQDLDIAEGGVLTLGERECSIQRRLRRPSSTSIATGCAGSSGGGATRPGIASGYRSVSISAYAVVCAPYPIA